MTTFPTKLGFMGRTGTGSMTGPHARPCSRSLTLCRFSRHSAGLKPLTPSRGIVARGPSGPGRISQGTVRWKRPSSLMRVDFSDHTPSIPCQRMTARVGLAPAAPRFSRTGFGLPDRDDAFDLVHRPGARGERLGPMGRGAREDDGVPSDRDAAHAVDDRHLEHAELRFRPFDELRQGPQRHRLVDLVVEGLHLEIRSDRPEKDDDGPRIVAAHTIHDRLDIDPGALDLDHRTPPLTGGKRATSSPSLKTLSGRTTSWFTARRCCSRDRRAAGISRGPPPRAGPPSFRAATSMRAAPRRRSRGTWRRASPAPA